MRTPYFELENIKLNYEFTLMEYDNIPLLFTCTYLDNRYLCLCNCINNGFRWIAAKCSTDTLKNLIEQRISIRDAFKTSQSPYYLIIGENSGEISYSQENFETLEADNEFPEPSLMLDDDFVDDDVKEQIIKLSENTTTRYHISSRFRIHVDNNISFLHIDMGQPKKPMQSSRPVPERETFLYNNTDKMQNVELPDTNMANTSHSCTLDELAA